MSSLNILNAESLGSRTVISSWLESVEKQGTRTSSERLCLLLWVLPLLIQQESPNPNPSERPLEGPTCQGPN